ncbi:MAG: SPASM domain-containing protein [Bacillota bacterium]
MLRLDAKVRERIHVFNVHGEALVLDVATGAVHRLSPAAVAVLGLDGEVTPAEAAAAATALGLDPQAGREALAELSEAAASGCLFTPDPRPPVGAPPPLRALCLNLAQGCNSACRYCFAAPRAAGPTRALMPPGVIRSALDLLLAASVPGAKVEVDFFGGEPLLNPVGLRYALEYGSQAAAACGKTVRFTLTTNALLLTEDILDLVDGYDVSLILSLDGRPAIHDAMRRTSSDEPTHAAALANCKRAATRRPGDHFIRGTFTAANPDFMPDIHYLVDQGFHRISMEPVVAPAHADYALSPAHLPALRRSYADLAEFCLSKRRQGRPFVFFHYELNLERPTCLSKRVTGCGAGSEYLAVAPDGSLWPCHQFVDREGFGLGDAAAGLAGPGVPERMWRNTVYAKSACRGCWARYLCGGGCHANAHEFTGDIASPYTFGCELVRLRLEYALYLASRPRG